VTRRFGESKSASNIYTASMVILVSSSAEAPVLLFRNRNHGWDVDIRSFAFKK
jgi:hypothetical protein